ncbi:Mur ligase family protein [Sporomusa malonica]|uniref:UDP-N-acetylmuramoylalanyl-D-glutamate--2,6-diaminopimelate ligase n=1 Tax=Sporomusa malonica TaxID=112901 RepID=A0A1W2E534_9FIRM|nr:UDP-N-acetylmuramyl-tripeptide synthetase [Sporomusa malonica]SMD04158.1 UDP-N-acetylmuramoylalanyl-D-glutamate--2,6-diaminopimelate ligase [Sporomusa malonica]
MQAFYDIAAKATGITCHSDNVRPGSIFVAIRGRKTDGNVFGLTAAAKGALAIVTDCPEHLPQVGIPVITVPDARLALSELAAAFYDQPSHKLNLIGVTGSNGKTTIACMLEHIFCQAGFRAGLIGTVRVNTGKSSFPSTLTTPDAVSVQHYLAEMRQNKVTHAAMEVSAQGVDMHRVAHVRFSAGLITNVCADHLDFHGSFASYLEAKTKFLGLLSPETPLIINIADPYCNKMATRFAGHLITVGVNSQADISARVTQSTAYSSTFMLEINNPVVAISGQQLPLGRHYFKLPLPGRHNVENAVLAATAALVHGIAPAMIALTLASFKGVERRMDVFHTSGLTIVDDTALNPGSIDAVFDTIGAFRYNRLFVVNAIRGQRGPAINAANAAAIANQQQTLPFELMITASTGHVSHSDAVTDEERLAFLSTLDTQKISYTYMSTLPASIKAVLDNAGPGDLIVLIGAQGMDAGRQVLMALAKSSAPQHLTHLPLSAEALC